MVMMPVPQYLVIDVYRFIASKEESKVNDMDKEQNDSVEDGYSWSEDDLRDTLDSGTRAIKTILPYLAKHADQKVPGKDLAELVYGQGASMQQLGGALGSFTKTAYKRYRRHKWPFEAIPPDENEPFWKYIMYLDTAEKVRKLTAE